MGERGPLKLPQYLQPVQDGAAAAPESLADTVRPVMPAKPDHLVGRLSDLWDEVGDALDGLGLMARCDGLALELALRHFIVATAASDDVGDDPRIYDDKNDRWMKNPSSQVFRDHSAAFLEYAKQLGMTFVARARTPVKGDDDGGADNPFAAPGS